MTIINDDSRIINKLEASLTDDARVIIYDCHMFIVQTTGWKSFQVQNALAYSASTSLTEKKSFITLLPGVNVIKLFSFVTDDKAQ